MKLFNKISMFIVAILIVGQLNAQDITAWSSLDTNAITIGGQVTYEIGITIPYEVLVGWPMIGDTLNSNIEVLRRTNIDTTYTDSDISLRQQLIITSFDSGYFEIAPTVFQFKHVNDSSIYTTSTGMLFLQVYVPEVDTSQAFKPLTGPIEEPYTLQELLPWIVVSTAVAILIGLLIFYLIKRKKKQPIFKRKPKPILPAHVVAITKLEELRLNKIWQSGRLKKYYSELTDIIREYMVNRYQFDAPEMTSYEIITKLHEFDINKDAMSKLESTMQLSDMVKFAKAIPTALENDLGLSHCVDFVNETKKIEDPVQTENANTKDSQ